MGVILSASSFPTVGVLHKQYKDVDLLHRLQIPKTTAWADLNKLKWLNEAHNCTVTWSFLRVFM